MFTFGSNKNLTLGLGDEDDRQFPERVTLSRPAHLLHRFQSEHEVTRAARRAPDNPAEHQDFDTIAKLPILIRSQPIVVRNIAMSKLHTAIITNDPESNLFMCGFGPGGRLGDGNEITRFNFVCIEVGGISGKKIVAIALGQETQADGFIA